MESDDKDLKIKKETTKRSYNNGKYFCMTEE